MGSSSMKYYLVVILIQVSFAVMILLSKAAFANGMSSYVFLFYRQAVGSIFLIPFTIILERKGKTSLSFVTTFKISMLAFLGITLGLNAYGAAVDFTSATLGAAAFNCLPVTTFFFAVLLGMEKVNIGTIPGGAKVFGIIVCIGGVATLAFYKGPYLKPLFHNQLLQYDHHNTQVNDHQAHASSTQRWIIGCFLLFISSISWGLWLVLQAQFLKTYPSTLVFTCIQTVSSAIQCFVVAIAFERNPSQWKLGFNIRFLAVLYCGIMVTCISNFLQSWVIRERGPVFQAVSTPLNMVVTMIGSEFLLAEGIHLGSVLGAILLVVSLYSVLWGKSKEQSTNGKNSSDHRLEVGQPQSQKEFGELNKNEPKLLEVTLST